VETTRARLPLEGRHATGPAQPAKAGGGSKRARWQATTPTRLCRAARANHRPPLKGEVGRQTCRHSGPAQPNPESRAEDATTAQLDSGIKFRNDAEGGKAACLE